MRKLNWATMRIIELNDMTTMLSDKTVKTRKEHQCMGCLQHFPAGTETSSQTIADNGTVYTFRMCMSCIIREWFGDGL